MKPEEINVVISEAVHGEDSEIEYINPASGMEPSGWRMSDENGDDTPVPNYYGDWNTRLDLLNALRPDQQLRLILNLWWHRGQAVDVNDEKANQDARELLILTMPQCEFCEMWLRTIGKWVETKGE